MGNSGRDTEANPEATEKVSIEVWGVVHEGAPDVFTRNVGGTIHSIKDKSNTLKTRVDISGEGSKTVIVEVYASGTANTPYGGTVSCLVIFV